MFFFKKSIINKLGFQLRYNWRGGYRKGDHIFYYKGLGLDPN